MVEVLPTNGVLSSLTGSIIATDLVIPIQPSDATAWPASGTYRAVLWQDPVSGPFEVVKVVSGQGTPSLGVQRAVEAYKGSQVALPWSAGSGIAAVLTRDGLSDVIGTGSALAIHTYDVVPAASATTVTLPVTPTSVFMVARNGVIQSAAAGHFSVSGAVLTFSAAFSGTDRVIVGYTA